jgi:hypothetical protein
MVRRDGEPRVAMRVFFGLICFVLFGAIQAAAQGTAASILGQVRDEGGGVLPGVTVTATSPSLQVPSITSVTDGQGEYRLSPLPIGVYAIEYELTGFQKVRREDIRLTVGFAAKVDVALGIGGVQESITVTGGSPLVDVTSTTTSTQFTREQLEVLPTSRNNISALTAQAPGVRSNMEVGGNVSFGAPGVRVFGQGAEPWYVLEGIYTTALQTAGGVGNYWDYGALEEAAVQTLGTNAEVGSRGVHVNAVVKSGGNDFHGTLFGGRMSDRFQSDNITPELAAQGITRGQPLVHLYDVSGDLGGRIVRDKLWFYGAGRYRENIRQVLGAVKTDGSPGTSDEGQRHFTGKVSYQMNASNRFVGFVQDSLRKPSTSTTQFTDWVARSTSYLYARTSKIEWQTVRGNSFVVAAQWGHWAYWDNPRFCIGAEELGRTCDPAAFDRFTMRISGSPVNEGQILRYSRHHPKATVSWYKPDLLLGNHEFKGGFELMPNRGGRGNIGRDSGNYRLIFNNGAPIEIETWNYPTYPKQHVDYTSFYAQDAWTIGRNLTLNLGVRYGHDNAYVPASCRDTATPPADAVFPATCFERTQFNVLNMWSPRLRAAYDLTGNGRTVIKGGFGRYSQMHMIDPDIQGADPNEQTTVTYRWRDLNNNRNYDPGEVNWNPNGPDFIGGSGVAAIGGLGGGVNQRPNPDEKAPTNDEYSLSLERQVLGTMAVRVTTLYTRTFDVYRLTNLARPYSVWNTPITRADPGPDGVLSTGDDPGSTVTFFVYPDALRGRDFERTMLINDSRATQTYKSLELAFARRMANRWQMSASYSATKTNNPIVDSLNPGEFSLTNRAGADDPNSEIFAANRTWEWLGRISGAYALPAQVMVSANFEHRSGNPWARQVLFTGVPILSSLTLRVEPIGAQRLPNLNVLDMRVEKAFSVGGNRRLRAQVNVYNLMNANTVTGVTVRSGPAFRRPTGILPPRNVELTASYTF